MKSMSGNVIDVLPRRYIKLRVLPAMGYRSDE